MSQTITAAIAAYEARRGDTETERLLARAANPEGALNAEERVAAFDRLAASHGISPDIWWPDNGETAAAYLAGLRAAVHRGMSPTKAIADPGEQGIRSTACDGRDARSLLPDAARAERASIEGWGMSRAAGGGLGPTARPETMPSLPQVPARVATRSVADVYADRAKTVRETQARNSGRAAPRQDEAREPVRTRSDLNRLSMEVLADRARAVRESRR